MEKYLDKCISSLLISQIDKLDIIIINDGSKDRTSEIGHKYESLYPNSVRCVDKENANYGSCVNRGLSIAKGKYIKILDADDSFYSSEFNSLITALKEIETDLVVCNYDIVDANGNITKKIRADRNIRFGSRVEFKDFEKFLEHPYFQMHAICYKSSLFKYINYKQTEGISYTDQEWMFMPMSNVHSATFLPFIIYKYLIGREGQTVDVCTNLKSLNHTLIVLTNLINNFNTAKSNLDASHLRYFEYRINLLLESTYGMCILKYPQTHVLEIIKEFDCNLKEMNINFFNSLNNNSIFGIKFINKWRSNNYVLPKYLIVLSYMVKSIIQIKQIKYKIKRR